jgi:hypothetical protein
MRLLASAAVVVALLGCGAAVDWSPAHPENKDYPRVVDTAVRVRHPGDQCTSAQMLIKLGVVHADGDEDEVIPAIAREAAEHGGTHYVVEGDKTQHDLSGVVYGGYAHLRDDPQRATWAVVYRCQ